MERKEAIQLKIEYEKLEKEKQKIQERTREINQRMLHISNSVSFMVNMGITPYSNNIFIWKCPYGHIIHSPDDPGICCDCHPIRKG